MRQLRLRPKIETSAFVFNIASRHGPTDHCQTLRTNVKTETRINETAYSLNSKAAIVLRSSHKNVCYIVKSLQSKPYSNNNIAMPKYNFKTFIFIIISFKIYSFAIGFYTSEGTCEFIRFTN